MAMTVAGAKEMLRDGWHKPPNYVTLARILLVVPVASWAMKPGLAGWLGLGCYILAAATDWVDGKLAKMNDNRWMSDLGRVLDPIADKFINFAALAILIVRVDDRQLLALLWTAIVVIALRECLVWRAKSRVKLGSASEAGRFTMGALVVALVLLLAPVDTVWNLFGLLPAAVDWSQVMLMFALGASCTSGWAYVRAPQST